MSRYDGFGFSEDEDHNFDYGDEYGEDEEHEAMLGATIPAELMNRWRQSEINLEGHKINFALLRQAIQMLERSFWWRFYTQNYKMQMVWDTYIAFSEMTDPES